MSLIENCQACFATDNLYEVLSVDKTATEKELKTAYKKASLKIHPDRVEEKDKAEATRKFQTLAKVYFILSDKESRAVYDETGEIDNENAIPSDKDWSAYWRLLFPKLTLKDIDDYVKKYKGSKEEIEDLRQCYTKFEGDMNKISENMLCYDAEDDERYREMINKLIKEGKVKSYEKFKKETVALRNARKKKYANEAAEAEELRTKLGLSKDGDEVSLKSAIMQRRSERKRGFDTLISSLEAKYSQPKGKKSKRGRK